MTWLDELTPKARTALAHIVATEGVDGLIDRLTGPRPRRPIPFQQRLAVEQRDGSCCRYCGIFTPAGHIDHIVPISAGGGNDPGNLVWACGRCNTKKGTKTGSVCDLCQRLTWPGNLEHTCNACAPTDPSQHWPCQRCAGHPGAHAHTDSSNYSWTWGDDL